MAKIEPSPKNSELTATLRERLSFRLFRTKDAPLWSQESRRIVVIGSGIGGMASAALFARLGHQVHVLESNPELIGGHARWLTFGGINFSMGPQYVWEFGEGELGNRFLRFLGLEENNPFALMQTDGFERVFIGHNEEREDSYHLNFRIPLVLERFQSRLTALFPEEKDKLDNLFQDMIGIYTAYKSFFSDHSLSEGRIYLATKFLLTGEASFSLKLKLGQTLFLTLREWFDQYGISSLPRRILYAHGGIFAESESEMSAIAFIVGTGNYHRGARYPVRGFHHLFESMANLIREKGGTVETGKRVTSLVTKDDLVQKALCEDGSEYPCDFVFSDISPRLTYRLLGKERTAFDYTPSHCIPTLCIAFRKGIEAMKDMKGRNFWWQDGNEVNYDDPDVTAPPRMLYIGSPTANGQSGLDGDGKDALVVFCAGNYRQEKEIYDRGPEAVRIFKEKLAGDVVDILDRNVFPGLKERLLFAEVVSSLDIEEATGGEMGNAYGRRMNVKEVLKGPVEEDDAPRNLFNVSATKNSPGIAGGISTAATLAEELTGMKI